MDTFFSQLSSLSLLSITVRLLLTTVFAGTLGYERERHRQAAGFRTYIIVADAAALVMMTNLYIGDVFGSTDLVRMPASVITGLGFLGAGTILVTKSHEIKGLTTAAGLWAVSIIGTAIGAGFYTGGTVCYAFILLAMNVLRLVDVRIQSRQKTATVYFELRSKLSIGQLVRLAREKDCTLSELELYADSGYGDNLVCGTFTLWAEGRTSLDDILYRHYLGGDEDSLSALMERHGDKLTLYLDGCLHDLHESEDLMIEVFAYLIAKQPRIRDGGFRAYLYRSARRPVLRRSSVSRWRCRPSRRASPARTTMAA